MGHKGRRSEFDYDSIELALLEFKKKFKSKTKNEWGTSKFIARTGKYVPIDVNFWKQ